MESAVCLCLFNRSRNVWIGVPHLDIPEIFSTLPWNLPPTFRTHIAPCAWLFFHDPPITYNSMQMVDGYIPKWNPNPKVRLSMEGINEDFILTPCSLRSSDRPWRLYLFQHKGLSLYCLTHSAGYVPPFITREVISNQNNPHGGSSDEEYEPKKKHKGNHPSTRNKGGSSTSQRRSTRLSGAVVTRNISENPCAYAVNCFKNEGFSTNGGNMDAKTPEVLYKAHLLDGRASCAANAFVNAGFSQDKLMTLPSAGHWFFRNKEHCKTSAAASLGMILLLDVDSGLSQLDKNFHSNDNSILAGALLGIGIVNWGIKNDCDPALALLGEYIDKEDSSVRIGAIMGLEIAYAGSQNDQIRSSLSPILNASKAPLDVIAFAALSLGMIYVGSCNEEVAQSIISALMDRSEAELSVPLTRFLPLGLGLLYVGKQESVEATAEVSKTFNEKIKKYCDMTLLSCAYAGTENVLKVQDLLAQFGEHQGPAVLELAMVAMSEELGLDMDIRSLVHMIQDGEQKIRCAVPLALGLQCISNSKVVAINKAFNPNGPNDVMVTLKDPTGTVLFP